MVQHSLPPVRDPWFPVDGPDHDVVIRSDVTLRRNLAEFRFAGQMDPGERVQLRQRVETVLHRIEEPFALVDPERLTPLLRSLVAHRNWIPAEGTLPGFVAPDSGLVIQLGGESHLGIIGRCGGLDLEGARRAAESIDRSLEPELDYAVSLQLGYLAATIEEAGTGLSAAVTLHLSALSESDGMVAAGSDASGRVTISGDGALYTLSCTARFGEEEEQTLATLAGFASRLVHYERAAREELFRVHGDMVAESAHRAYGTLLHARRLDSEEAAELLLLVRMAVAAGLVDGVSLAAVTHAMSGSWGAHVAALCEEDERAADRCRARWIQDVIQPRTTTGD